MKWENISANSEKVTIDTCGWNPGNGQPFFVALPTVASKNAVL
jgi:hypothetical protein